MFKSICKRINDFICKYSKFIQVVIIATASIIAISLATCQLSNIILVADVQYSSIKHAIVEAGSLTSVTLSQFDGLSGEDYLKALGNIRNTGITVLCIVAAGLGCAYVLGRLAKRGKALDAEAEDIAVTMQSLDDELVEVKQSIEVTTQSIDDEIGSLENHLQTVKVAPLNESSGFTVGTLSAKMVAAIKKVHPGDLGVPTKQLNTEC